MSRDRRQVERGWKLLSSCNYSLCTLKIGKTGLKVYRLAFNFGVICTSPSEKADCSVNEMLLSNLSEKLTHSDCKAWLPYISVGNILKPQPNDKI